MEIVGENGIKLANYLAWLQARYDLAQERTVELFVAAVRDMEVNTEICSYIEWVLDGCLI